MRVPGLPVSMTITREVAATSAPGGSSGQLRTRTQDETHLADKIAAIVPARSIHMRAVMLHGTAGDAAQIDGSGALAAGFAAMVEGGVT